MANTAPLIALSLSSYNRDKEMRALWHEILSNEELLSKLPSDIWHGHKLQEILWSGKINEKKPGWEDTLVRLWK